MLSIEAWFEVGLLLQFLNLYTNFSALPDFQTMPPAVALLGEIELMDGVGGHVPQDRAVAIASMAKTCGCARAFS
jgi:hypothetical protein